VKWRKHGPRGGGMPQVHVAAATRPGGCPDASLRRGVTFRLPP
jgi:hypothetical protein